MAERRMFSRSVVGCARFLKMPVSSRLLYYDLGMEADDDGFVEAFGVLRRTGATEDDLRVLVSRSFVKVVNEDLVAYITDWKRNNYIRPDRYHPSQYQPLLLQIGDGIPMVDQGYTEVRLGKDSIGKSSIGEREAADKPPAPIRHRYGEYQNVFLTTDELNQLQTEIPYCTQLIERFSEHKASTGKTYSSDFATLRKWFHEDQKKAESQNKANQPSGILGAAELEAIQMALREETT